MTPASSRVRMWRFYFLSRRTGTPRPGWYSQEVNEYGYSIARPCGPFRTYDAAFDAAGEETTTPTPEVRHAVP